jgi:hypothetical protein
MSLNFTRFVVVLLVSIVASSSGAKAQCVPIYTFGCLNGDEINSVTVTGQASNLSDLTTGCGIANGYQDRTTVVPAVDLMQGGVYSGTLHSSGFSEYYRIWIDFNNNNTYEATEDMSNGNIGPTGGNISNFTLSIPFSAAVGVHRMRIRLVLNPGSAIDPCITYGSGETHDYLVNILAAPACSGAPVITSITPAGPISTCPGNSQTLTVNVPLASGYFFQWQESTNGGATWTNVGTNSNVYTFTPTTTTLYHAIVTCTNTSTPSTSANVTVNAAPPTYAALPYFQDFETWTNYCDSMDIPVGTGTNWENDPSTGDDSWRRDDQGATANWTFNFGGYFPPSISGLHSARFPSSIASGLPPGDLDLYVNCSAQVGNKALYFYHINQVAFSVGDTLLVLLSTNGGTSFTQIGSFDTATSWKKHYLPIVSNSAQTIIRFRGTNPSFDWTDIGLDSVYVAPPCLGTPVAGLVSPAGTQSGCPGGTYNLSVTGSSMAGNLTYQWQQSINNGVTWTNIPGANNIAYTTPALYDTVRYRMYVVCNGSSLADTSTAVIFNIAAPIYASLPYTQGFETWVNYCDVLDVPGTSWLNTPATGDDSWRRDDQGASANWIFPPGGAYVPAAYQGSHSARFHTFFSFASGDLDLFVDCSAPGNKELQFHHINPGGSDAIEIWLSTNGGTTFTQLQSWNIAAAWTLRSVPIISTSAQTVIKFRAVADFSDDMGIDNVQVLLPCTGTPVAGVVDTMSRCSGQAFDLNATGTTLAAGLAYQWQESPNGTTWTNVPGGTSAMLQGVIITTPTWYRLIVNCTNSGLADTTDPQLIQIAPFYYCYCGSAAGLPDNEDIGNVTIRKYPTNVQIFTNGIASPLSNNPTAVSTYTNYTGLAPIQLYKDSIYRFFVTQINETTFFASNVAIYIDLDRDGVFNPITEKILQKTTAQPSQQINDTFHIPTTAQVGVTGMRVVLVEGSFSLPDPCFPYLFGETEDYLVNINYTPCNGPTNAGIAHISDTLICPNFPITLIDTSHEHKMSNISWSWQSSPDNVNWTTIAGSANKDTLIQTSGNNNIYYRLEMNCSTSGTNSYSNVVALVIRPPYQCYCSSYAIGDIITDQSDVGAFSIGSYVFNTGGPHLNNPAATRSYTTYPGPANILTLYADSAYAVSLYHVIRGGVHEDAKATLFIDFNNNFVYDIPDERVWTGFTSSSSIFINTNVNIPASAVKNVLTGMRLILNSNTGPNVPSDEACGTYVSGETEDFGVRIKDKNAMLGVNSVSGLSSFSLYPNPTTGVVTIHLSQGKVSNEAISLRVTTITGQVVLSKEYSDTPKEFTTSVDLSGHANGVYLVELSNGSERSVKKLMLK